MDLPTTSPVPARDGGLPAWLDAPSRWTALDPVTRGLQRFVTGLPLGRARDLLHGRWLGHPLHPALTQVPIGCWISAGILDLMSPFSGSNEGAARRLTGVGLAATPVAFWAGWVDWAELSPVRRRIGLVHAVSAVTATGFQIASLRARRSGRRIAGCAYGLAGNGTVTLAAALGAHLAYRRTDGGPGLAQGPDYAAPEEQQPLFDARILAERGAD